MLALKDVPTLRAEFGHPEVAICLTCLSYYYGGLSEEHIRECFHLLFKLDNPQVEYEGWVRRSKDTVPDVLRQITGVNTQDAHQFSENVVPLFSRNQAVIDFFLSRVCISLLNCYGHLLTANSGCFPQTCEGIPGETVHIRLGSRRNKIQCDDRIQRYQ